MAYCCNGICARYSTNGVVTKNHTSIYDIGFVRCSICRTGFSIEHTKLDGMSIKSSLCCGARVRVKARGKSRMVMPVITMVKKIKN